MADPSDDLFGEINKIDPFGPYRRREMKLERSNGEERLVQITRIETAIDGAWNVIEEVRYLCQACGIEWITPGLDGFSNKNGKILCSKCSRNAKIMSALKHAFSLFIRSKESK